MLSFRLFPIVFISASLLAQDAQSTDPKQRAKAARDIAKHDSNAIQSLKPFLSDSDEGVRFEAVKGIAETGTQASLDPLVQAAKDNDPQIQIKATDGLVNFYLPGYLQGTIQRLGSAIKNRFSDQNDQVVPAYVTVRPDVIQALGRLIRGGASMEARANAARAAGILRGVAVKQDLIDALHSKDDNLLYESLIALQKIRDPSVASRIIFLFNDLQEKVQIAALETAGVLRSKEALPDLRKTFDRARNEKVRRAALTAIAMIPDEQSRALYQRALGDKDESLRAAAAEGLGRLGNAAGPASFEQSFNDEKKMKPRLAYAFASVSAGATETSTFSPLQYLVNTLNSKIYRGIAEAYLIELARQPQVRENIYAQLKQGTKDEKMGLARVLAVSGDKNSVAPLEQLTKDPDTEVAQECLRSLRVLKARL